MNAWIGMILLIVAGAVLMLTDNPGEKMGLADADLGRLIKGVALIMVIGTSMLFSYRGRASLALKQALTWAAIGLGLIVIYSYRAEFMGLGARLSGELKPGGHVVIPPTDTRPGGRAVAVSANVQGQFSLEAMINASHVRMLADTGATVVTLTYEDARRVGFDVKNLQYTVPVMTANGKTMSARVRLHNIGIGPISVRNVDALVAQPGTLHTSLLGMNFLNSLSSFEISGNRLILRQ